jgi:hypothetical protein
VRANEGVRQVTFQIERIRSYLVGHKPAPGRLHHGFEHNNNGFLVTGYEDGGDWLVSPLGRQTSGKIITGCTSISSTSRRNPMRRYRVFR